MVLFYFPDVAFSDLITLPEDESRHCVRVMRLSEGCEIYVADGHGLMCRCQIVHADSSECVAQVLERMPNYDSRNYHLHVAVAATKNAARIEWFVEKAIEIGIDEITILECDNSEHTNLRAERLQKIAISAMKQSLRATLPAIHSSVQYSEFMKQLEHTAQPLSKLICHCEGSQRTGIKQVCDKGDHVVVLIGPEGDFSESEIAMAKQCGFCPITLGTWRLRTETAALYAVAAVNFINS
ncbi:MAG: 16S rRNA (uracil(1498)-N(3))-methyltransferase [Bacteroidales bacterium]|nr:16S rRNA (uracil(1498)-N(3))-methyltransferase [Candidatus Colimorpha onthohippi]